MSRRRVSWVRPKSGPGRPGGLVLARAVRLRGPPLVTACVALLLLVVRCARAGRSDKQLPSVGEGHTSAVGDRRAVLRLVPFDDHLGPDRQRVLVPPSSEELIRSSHLDLP